MRGRLHWRAVTAVIVTGLVISAISVEVMSRLRLPSPRAPGSAAIEMLAADPRPAIWDAYWRLAIKHPWFGIGLGRTLPSKVYRLEDDAALRQIDAHAPTHAHNVLLDLVLQVGVVGLAIWLWLHIAILRLVIQRARHGDERAMTWAAAAVALVVAMLVKNSTNDLIVFGNALLFWALFGAAFGMVLSNGDNTSIDSLRRAAVRT